MKGKGGIIGTIVTLVIGGSVYSASKTDIVKYFSNDTGLSQEESQQYVENIADDDLVSFDKLGEEFVSEGKDILETATIMDCDKYTYEWESDTVSCTEGKAQLARLGKDEIELGRSYITLASDKATKADMSSTIVLIDKLNKDYTQEVISQILDTQTIDEIRRTNSFNKALLKAALDGE